MIIALRERMRKAVGRKNRCEADTADVKPTQPDVKPTQPM
jgi:hypothetical protein